MDERKDYYVKSAIRVLDILENMIESGGEVRIKDLSDSMGVTKSTIHRFLTTLEFKGYVEQKEDGKYRLTLHLFELGNSILHSLDLHSCSLPILQELNKKLGETIHLVILDKGDAVFINKLVNQPSLVTFSYIGKRIHAHCLASGKVLLAYLSEEELEKIICEKGLHSYTPNTITDRDILINELKTIKEQNLAYSIEEYQLGVVGVAAPIKNHLGQVVSSVSISGSSMIMQPYLINNYASDIKEAAANISQKLGYRIK